MSLQAIIMAGGEGERLRPLTCLLPKPLAPLLGEPVMGYAVKLLKRHGMDSIGVTLWYQPDKIRRAFGRGEKYRVRMKYFEETEPMGTAGSVKLAEKCIGGTFFILSGDGLTDCDLTQALRFHQRKKALATLVLKSVPMPLPYGVVLTDREGRITRFIEKPGWNNVFSDLVNTGIYILEPEIFSHIPDGGSPDFGKDIFPALAAAGLPIYGYETKGYWCDVGDQRAYLQAQRDLLAGRVDLPHPSGVDPNAVVSPEAKVSGNCWIGPGTVVEKGAVIRDSVLGEGCTVGRGAVIENACLWDESQAQEKARIAGSVLCSGATARIGAEMGDGCALGERESAGAWSLLKPGVKIWPHLKAAPGAVVSHSVTAGDFTAPQWTDQGADCDSMESACALCGAFIKVLGLRRAAIAHRDAEALKTVAAGALSAQGLRVLDGGTASAQMLRLWIHALRLDGGVYCQGQTIRFLGRDGAALTQRQRTAMSACVLRQDTPPAFAKKGELIPLAGAEDLYLAQLIPWKTETALLSPVAVYCADPKILCLAKEGLSRLNARNARFADKPGEDRRPGETGFLISDDGAEVIAFTAQRALSKEETVLLLLALFYRQEGGLYDLAYLPRAAAGISPLLPKDDSERCFRLQTVLGDGLAGMLLMAEGMKREPMEALLKELPSVHTHSREIPCRAQDKGKILHALCENETRPHSLNDGLHVRHENGYADIVPDAYRGLVRVSSESGDSETAKELCDFYQKKIEALVEAPSGISLKKPEQGAPPA